MEPKSIIVLYPLPCKGFFGIYTVFRCKFSLCLYLIFLEREFSFVLLLFRGGIRRQPVSIQFLDKWVPDFFLCGKTSFFHEFLTG